jgi:hypothetical protein
VENQPPEPPQVIGQFFYVHQIGDARIYVPVPEMTAAERLANRAQYATEFGISMIAFRTPDNMQMSHSNDIRVLDQEGSELEYDLGNLGIAEI